MSVKIECCGRELPALPPNMPSRISHCGECGNRFYTIELANGVVQIITQRMKPEDTPFKTATRDPGADWR